MRSVGITASNYSSFAPTFVGSTKADSTILNLPSGMAQNDIVIYNAVADSSALSNPAGWTQIADNGLYVVGYKFMGSTPDTSVTFNTNCTVVCVAFRGVNTSSPVDASWLGSSTLTPPGITTLVNNALIIAIAAGTGSGIGKEITSGPSGYTTYISDYSTAETGSQGAIAYKIEQIAGAKTIGAFGASGLIENDFSGRISFSPA